MYQSCVALAVAFHSEKAGTGQDNALKYATVVPFQILSNSSLHPIRGYTV
jgi:hypothetical protein